MEVRTEVQPDYGPSPEAVDSDGKIINKALLILESRLLRSKVQILANSDACRFLKLKLAERGHEVFGCIWPDTRHRVLGIHTLFRGTIDGASVYPREVVKEALAANAAAVILFHNHPSGDPEPSPADKHLTNKLSTALSAVDIRVLDHIVIGGVTHVSFSEAGLL